MLILSLIPCSGSRPVPLPRGRHCSDNLSSRQSTLNHSFTHRSRIHSQSRGDKIVPRNNDGLLKSPSSLLPKMISAVHTVQSASTVDIHCMFVALEPASQPTRTAANTWLLECKLVVSQVLQSSCAYNYIHAAAAALQ